MKVFCNKIFTRNFTIIILLQNVHWKSKLDCNINILLFIHTFNITEHRWKSIDFQWNISISILSFELLSKTVFLMINILKVIIQKYKPIWFLQSSSYRITNIKFNSFLTHTSIYYNLKLAYLKIPESPISNIK